MNALEALRLARETGCKVRPKGGPVFYFYDGDGELRNRNDKGRSAGAYNIVIADDLINSNGPVEWHVVE